MTEIVFVVEEAPEGALPPRPLALRFTPRPTRSSRFAPRSGKPWPASSRRAWAEGDQARNYDSRPFIRDASASESGTMTKEQGTLGQRIVT